MIFMPVARRKFRFLDMSIKWERVYSGRIPFVYRNITGLIQASRRCLAGCSPCGGLLHFVRTAGYIKARARLVQAITSLVFEGASTPYTRSWLPRRGRLCKKIRSSQRSPGPKHPLRMCPVGHHRTWYTSTLKRRPQSTKAT